jgi:hypothetical protein
MARLVRANTGPWTAALGRAGHGVASTLLGSRGCVPRGERKAQGDVCAATLDSARGEAGHPGRRSGDQRSGSWGS